MTMTSQRGKVTRRVKMFGRRGIPPGGPGGGYIGAVGGEYIGPDGWGGGNGPDGGGIGPDHCCWGSG